MRLDDIASVQTVETQSFSAPWSAQAYEQDLRNNRLAHYIVLREIADDNATVAAALPSPQAQPGRQTMRQGAAKRVAATARQDGGVSARAAPSDCRLRRHMADG